MEGEVGGATEDEGEERRERGGQGTEYRVQDMTLATCVRQTWG